MLMIIKFATYVFKEQIWGIKSHLVLVCVVMVTVPW